MAKKQTNSENSNTSIKDLLGMVKDDIQKDLLRIEEKLDLHVQMGDKERSVYTDAIAKHDALIKHVCDELPEKGYCAKVDTMYGDLYPSEGLSLPQRIDILMYDRAILKWILGTTITALFMSVVSLLKIFFNL